MKKALLTLAAFLCFGSAIAEDRPVDYNTFPAPAKEFITKHFANTTVASSMVDDDGEFTAILKNGAKIEFRSTGAWKEINGKGSALPASVIPAEIAKYVKANYSAMTINKIEVDATKYEVKLSNNVELEFDLKGIFLRQDK